MAYDEAKLNRLKSKAEGFRQHAIALGDERSAAAGRLRELEAQRKQAERSRRFYPDEIRSAAEHRQLHLAAIDQSIAETRRERERLDAEYAEINQRHADAQALLAACEQYAKDMEVNS